MVAALTTHRISYTPVPGAASTAVKRALMALDGTVPDKVARDIAADANRVHVLYPTRKFRKARLAAHEGWFNFTVVRDPVARLLSVYGEALASGDLARAEHRRRGWAPLPATPDPDDFFENFSAYRAASVTVKSRSVPQVAFTGEDLSLYSRIYRAETLDAARRDLSRRTGKIVAFPTSPEARARLALRDLGPRAQSAVLAEVAPDRALYDNVLRLSVA
ncbi:sulfotransferase family 2 domain-containing protein [uncultured Maritimibacter sp.]|jgi:hypothetical protein|uniref:sulfotransferase family 2 domain-containing protein n=1 Tax=uncultured Maritimibacter sp. TaxID=991866 RepID=UPI00262B0D2E|nr:sulfotransferase family 2 domain-containing protein [uncultured Maritimibacter sp.]